MTGVLRNLETINRFLGGFSTTLPAVPRMMPPGQTRVRVLDVGAGGGDLARRLVTWGAAHGRRVEVTALDRSGAASAFALTSLRDVEGAGVVQGDVFALPFADASFDLVVCSLFLHHFGESDVGRVLGAMLRVSRHGVIVNDLHRHPIAWMGIRALCWLFRAHPVVRHDAAVSVLRGFRRAELASCAQRLGIPLDIQWRWAFRYQVLARPPERAALGAA
jgi:ubiquinone/menaquinone biosynthesis C-methylase UbiE